MKIHRTVLILPLLAAFLFAEDQAAPTAPPKPKADAKPKPAKFDEASKKLFDSWRKLEYRWEGVKQATCKIAGTLSMMGQQMTTKGSYVYDGKSSTLTYDPGQAGAMLAQQGWNKDAFDGHWKDGWQEMVAGGTFTATKTDAGTTVKVTGDTKGKTQAVYFDKAGMLVKMDFLAGGGAQTMKASYEPRYKKLDSGKYIVAGWTVKADVPGMGLYVEKTELSYAVVGKRHVTTKAISTAEMGGQPMGETKRITFDWKFGEKTEAAAPSNSDK